MSPNNECAQFERLLAGRRVLVTGHTGFKGSWLTLWLRSMGAEVHGIALEPDTDPSLFYALGLQASIDHRIMDIRDRQKLIQSISEIDPEVVFHLAAQPLVRRSYDFPLDTFETNVMGTAYVLEACRQAKSTLAIICVTTDKVYNNNEWIWPYRETDRLGGNDPYSASKAAAELVAASYRKSFPSSGYALATARGGNVIGGGDWSQDRLIPDVVRAIRSGQSLTIRNPNASRPWQHVLTLCHGYLQLAASMLLAPEVYQEAWNFGPGDEGSVTVTQLLKAFEESWELPEIVTEAAEGYVESQLLSLDSTKARLKLRWSPSWTFLESVQNTAVWYRDFYDRPQRAAEISTEQLELYRRTLSEKSVLDR